MTDDDGFQFFQAAIAAHDAPAFMRRAREMEFAWDYLREKLREQRQTFLEFPKLRLATLTALIGPEQSALPKVCHPDDFAYLKQLMREWSPKLRIPIRPTTTERPVTRALMELRDSFERFNRRWTKLVTEIDLSRINLLRENYNRYYVLEKECAIWSSDIAVNGFTPISPATHDELFAEFPLLRIPRT